MIMLQIVLPCLLALALSGLGIRFPLYRMLEGQKLENRGGVQYAKGDEEPLAWCQLTHCLLMAWRFIATRTEQSSKKAPT